MSVSAAQLADADIVLTSYEVLMKDVHRQSDPEEELRSFRSAKRYQVTLGLYK